MPNTASRRRKGGPVRPVVHHELVDPVARLQSDPRTQQVGRDPAVRRMLRKREAELLAALGPDETVQHVLVTMGSVPGLGVITTSRLLLLSYVPLHEARAALAPYRVHVQKKGFVGTKVDVIDDCGTTLRLHLLDSKDLDALQRTATGGPGAPGSSPPPPDTTHHDSPETPPPPTWAAGARRSDTRRGGDESWQWHRPVQMWQDAEQLAADHMTYLGFQGVIGTMSGSDGGLDVVAEGAAAQVKFHTDPTGSPDIQRLRGAANPFSRRLFYATAYSPAALMAANQLGIATFQYTHAGLVVPVNDPARDATTSTDAPSPERTAWGSLTFESRQNRATRWALQIQDATKTPISDRKRKGARQLIEREQALQHMLRGLEILTDTDNPLYKRGRRERTLAEAEKQLKLAAKTLRINLT